VSPDKSSPIKGESSSNEAYGIKQLAALDAEENDLIAEAKAAQALGNFKIMEYKLSQAEAKRAEKIAEAEAMNQEIAKQNESIRARNEAMQTEEGIYNLYSSGVTDPAEIAKQLRSQGRSVSLKDVSDNVALMSGIGGTGIVGEYNYYVADAKKRGQVPVSFTEYQNQDANRKVSIAKAGVSSGTGGGLYDQLDYRTANAVISQGNSFGTSDIVKKYNNIVAASNLIAGVDPYTKNPAEHQAVIYNFAKALDPDSVVREGEYATVKKYSQSLIEKYGGEIEQAIAGTGFLSPKAIKAIQEATDNRIKAYEPQYNNLKKQTADRINSIAGKDIADMVLLDYEQGYTGNIGDNLIKSEEQAENLISASLPELEESNPSLYSTISDMYLSVNPETGQPYTASEILQAFPELSR